LKEDIPLPEHSESTRQMVEQLTLEEKAWLVSGGDKSKTVAVDELNCFRRFRWCELFLIEN
jgi:hypothetical protein